jgi:hypothetical protein
MRIAKVNRAWIPAFLLFYVALTTASVSEHTSSLTHNFVPGAKSKTFNKRLQTPRYSVKRIAEDSAVTGTNNRFSAPPTEAENTLTLTEQFNDGLKALTASRAPPALL